MQSIYLLNYPTATITDTSTQLIVHYVLESPYSIPPISIEFAYSKTDGIVNQVSETWYNETSPQIFYSDLVRVYEIYPTLFIVFAISGITVVALVIFLSVRQTPEILYTSPSS